MCSAFSTVVAIVCSSSAPVPARSNKTESVTQEAAAAVLSRALIDRSVPRCIVQCQVPSWDNNNKDKKRAYERERKRERQIEKIVSKFELHSKIYLLSASLFLVAVAPEPSLIEIERARICFGAQQLLSAGCGSAGKQKRNKATRLIQWVLFSVCLKINIKTVS